MKKIFTILSAVLLCLTASAQEPNVKLADVIKNAIATSTEPVVPVLLDNHKVYELDSYVDVSAMVMIRVKQLVLNNATKAVSKRDVSLCISVRF